MGEVGFALGRIASGIRKIASGIRKIGQVASKRRLKTPSRSDLVYWAITLFFYAFFGLLLLGVLASLLAE
jgi:hypothetical protein